MKRLLYYFIAIVSILSLGSCQNNGYIGWIFGVWRVESYTVDGQRQDSEMIRNATFGFQNNIVNVVTYTDAETLSDQIDNYGTWREDGEWFEFNFSHSDYNNPPNTGIYSVPYWLGFVSGEVMRMKIVERKGNTFKLQWQDPDGKLREYKFEKTW